MATFNKNFKILLERTFFSAVTLCDVPIAIRRSLTPLFLGVFSQSDHLHLWPQRHSSRRTFHDKSAPQLSSKTRFTTSGKGWISMKLLHGISSENVEKLLAFFTDNYLIWPLCFCLEGNNHCSHLQTWETCSPYLLILNEHLNLCSDAISHD